jgi:hypothetical protein
MPLYVEDMVSEATKAMVEEHIKECKNCSSKIQSMQKELVLPADTITAPLESLKKKLSHKKFNLILLSVFLAVAIMTLVFLFVMAPIPMNYANNLIQVEEQDNGSILVTIRGEAAGYDVSGYASESNNIRNDSTAPSYTYHITVWNSLWNKYIAKKENRSFIINSNDAGGYEDVLAIYYYSTETAKDGNHSNDLLLYGTDLYSSGGVVTLPRLALSYYFILALLFTVIGFILYALSRRHQRMHSIIKYITILPLSFMISMISIKRFHFSSYYLLKDLTGILLLMIPIYFIVLILYQLIRERFNKW